MFVRNTPARTTSSKLLLAALRTADRFSKTRSVSGTMPPSTTLPVAGSWATCPLRKRKPSILTAWENGPTGGASSVEVIAVLLIVTPLTEVRRPPTIPQVHYSHYDLADFARFGYGREEVSGGFRARRLARARRVCPGGVDRRRSGSSVPDTLGCHPATAKAGGGIGCRVTR